MGDPGIVVQPVGEDNFEASVQFLTGWVSDDAAEARAYLAGHSEPAGVATFLMDAAEQLAWERGVTTLGITVGLFDEYGPAQRLYGQRGYVPDGRGACRGQRPLGKGMQVTMDDDLIMWLTKDLARLPPA
jgi:GNAT superfamily N-acetyltransferase